MESLCLLDIARTSREGAVDATQRAVTMSALGVATTVINSAALPFVPYEGLPGSLRNQAADKRRSEAMTSEDGEGGPGRRLLLGDAGPHPQAARRDLHPRGLHRRRRRRTPRTATTALTPKPSRSCSTRAGDSTATCSSSSSRSTTRPRATGRATTSAPATARRSSTSTRSSARSPRTPSPTSTRRGCGRARWSPRSRPRVRSGRPSRSTRTTWNATRTATHAISRARAGSCPAGVPRLANRRSARTLLREYIEQGGLGVEGAAAGSKTRPAQPTVSAHRGYVDFVAQLGRLRFAGRSL